MASSTSLEADQASGQLAPIEYMNRKYYEAAEGGEFEIFRGIGELLTRILTPKRNTVLHVYLTALTEESESSPTNFVDEIHNEIHNVCSSLLWQANAKGETPLHIASRYGHVSMVNALIRHVESLQGDLERGDIITVKEMLEMPNKEKDTALHEAVRNNHPDVVKLLIEKGPGFSYSANYIGETPLYIAVERKFKPLAFEILQSCTSPAHGGPFGRTTLHAAVIWGDKGMVEKILEKILENGPRALIKQADDQGSTSLHYAASKYCTFITELLLKNDRALAYMKDKKGRTALHIAADLGFHEIIKEILSSCPDCCEIVDNSGRNAVHFLVSSSKNDLENRSLRLILHRPSFSHLLNEKDVDGNTPLHYHSKSSQYLEDLMCHDRVDKMAFNNENLDACDIALTNSNLSEEKVREIESFYGHFDRFQRSSMDDMNKLEKKRF